MKKRITEKKLRRFYRLLSVRMIDFDCGRLCAPGNGGIPYCCDNDGVVPILFHEEYAWRRKTGKFWKRMPPKNREIRKFIEESESYYVFSQCPGPGRCARSKRSFNCMTYPFEPHVNKDGEIVGLTFVNTDKDDCPLVGKSKKVFNPVYISNCITFWRELFELYPEEEELYIDESSKRERRAKRNGTRIPILR
jgi:hypothetical protein